MVILQATEKLFKTFTGMHIVKMNIAQQMPAAKRLCCATAFKNQLLLPGPAPDQVCLKKWYRQKWNVGEYFYRGHINFKQINVFPVKGIVLYLVVKHLQCNTDEAFIVLIVYLGGKTFKSLQVLIILTILKFKDES